MSIVYLEGNVDFHFAVNQLVSLKKHFCGFIGETQIDNNNRAEGREGWSDIF